MARLWFFTAIAVTTGVSTGLITGLKVLSLDKSEPTGAKLAEAAIVPSGTLDLDLYRGAIAFSQRAIAAAKSAETAESSTLRFNYLRQERFLWQSALQQLADIPENALLYERAATKKKLYGESLSAAESKIAKANATFIADIVQDNGIDLARSHITLCQLTRPQPSAPKASEKELSDRALPESPPSSLLVQDGQINPERCRHHQGDQRLASSASLIKLPIAMALLAKVHAENLDLDDPILLDPNNFTENTEGAILTVGNEYPLREVMVEMIKKSDNIATNQLIDYLGYDYIDQAMRQLGYSKTSVGHKLMGYQTMPVYFGGGINQSTTHEITAMMGQIYSFHEDGDGEIMKALGGQQDRELGYEALKGLGEKVKWLGEKTGQNKRVLASTLAMDIGEDRYVLTVAVDYEDSVYALRRIIHDIAAHLAKNGSLAATVAISPAQ